MIKYVMYLLKDESIVSDFFRVLYLVDSAEYNRLLFDI